MATPQSPTDGARRISRNISHPLKRRSTKGPLDTEEDPLAEPSRLAPDTSPTTPSTITATVDPTAVPEDHSPVTTNLSFLQDRRSYHKIPTTDVPQAFLKSGHQPALETPLSDLLRQGHFRRAAEAALNDLLQTSLSAPERILQLLYCRLACLVLIGRHDFAADEAIPLYNYLSSNAPDVAEVTACTPWELRVLLVRLQLFSTQDGGRRAIMNFYGLASEVRANVRRANDDATKHKWCQCLRELGLRVADALVEIGELETAHRHLDTLRDADIGEVAVRKTLLDIHIGNVAAASKDLAHVEDEQSRLILETLLRTAQHGPEQGLEAWQKLSQVDKANQLAKQNEAVFMLYTGRIDEARITLQNTVKGMPVNSTLLLNLSTIHELCSEKAMLKKLGIAEEFAHKTPDPAAGGWERLNSELKL